MQINFKEKLEEVKTGKIYNKFGLDCNPFAPSPPDIKKSFINREKEIDKFIRTIYDLIQNRAPHIPILGNHGIGKTHFLQYIFEIVKENKKELNLDEVYFMRGEKEFKEKIMVNRLDWRYENKKILIFVDDLDIITIHDTPNANIFFDENYGKIIGTWNFKAWHNVNRKVDFKIPKSEPLILDPFNIANLKEILRKRLELSTNNVNLINSFFPEEVLDMISFASQGNPHRLMAIARIYLDFLFNEKVLEVTSDVINEFANKINLRSLEESFKKLDELTPKQKEILKRVIDLEEVSASKLAEIYRFSRVAAVQFLKTLQEKGLLESREKNRVVYYYVPTEIVDEIDEKLAKLENE